MGRLGQRHPVSTPATSIDEAIDRAPMRAALAIPLAACALVMIVDGFDLAAMPMTVPHVSRALGIRPSDFGPALAAVLVGMGVGAVVLGPLGDRFGRRPVAIVHLALIGLATLGTASAATLDQFLLWRLLTGLGLGGCLPNITALTAEISPRRIRARVLTITACGASVGGFAAGFVIPPLIRLGGWEMPFLVAGGGTLLLALLLLAVLPESPKYFAARAPGHPGFARVAARLGLGDPAAFATPPVETPRVPILALFGPRFRLATAVFAGIYTINALSLYMLASWLPTVLPRAGFSLAEAARLAGILQAGGLVGGIGISVFLDRGHAARALAGAYACVVAALLSFSVLAPDPLSWGALVLVVGAGIAGGHLALLAVGAGLYPAPVLTSAIGFAVAVARIGAVGGPLLGALFVRGQASPQSFFLAVIAPVLLCIAGVALLPRVQRRVAAVE